MRDLLIDICYLLGVVLGAAGAGLQFGLGYALIVAGAGLIVMAILGADK